MPVWKMNDCLGVGIFTNAGIGKISYFKNNSTEDTKTASFDYSGGQSFHPQNGDFLLAFYNNNENFGMYIVDDDLIVEYSGNTRTFVPGQHMYNDFLVSQKIADASSAVKDNKICLQFKRISSVVRIKVKDNTGRFANSKINSMMLETQKTEIHGKTNYNIVTGAFTDFDNAINDKLLLIESEGNLIRANNKDQAFFCMRPATITSDDELIIYINTEDGYGFQKNIKIPAEGIKFEAGKITTLVLSLNENEISYDPTFRPEVTSGQIISKKEGYIDGTDVNQAMPEGTKSLKVTGDINNSDITYISPFFNDGNYTDFTLDLSAANIKKDDKIILEDNTLKDYSIAYMNSLKTLLLPESLTKIYANAILELPNVTNITIGKSITQIEAGAIAASTTAAAEVTFKAPYSAVLDANIADNFATVFTGSTLIINETWKSHITGNTWKGITWGKIVFVTEGGANLPTVIDNGNVL